MAFIPNPRSLDYVATCSPEFSLWRCQLYRRLRHLKWSFSRSTSWRRFACHLGGEGQDAKCSPFGYCNRRVYGHLPTASLRRSSAVDQEECPLCPDDKKHNARMTGVIGKWTKPKIKYRSKHFRRPSVVERVGDFVNKHRDPRAPPRGAPPVYV